MKKEPSDNKLDLTLCSNNSSRAFLSAKGNWKLNRVWQISLIWILINRDWSPIKLTPKSTLLKVWSNNIEKSDYKCQNKLVVIQPQRYLNIPNPIKLHSCIKTINKSGKIIHSRLSQPILNYLNLKLAPLRQTRSLFLPIISKRGIIRWG